ncbi:MAG: zinc ribbon domain-containing protein [Gemmatimonadaceae bacterium]|nr:zinc ribbon domain-containing protein [Gemmatimonadaceae bacterium]
MSIPLLVGTLLALVALAVVLYPLFFAEDEAMDAVRLPAGEPPTPGCPTCGAPLLVNARFCAQCGARLPDGAP